MISNLFSQNIIFSNNNLVKSRGQGRTWTNPRTGPVEIASMATAPGTSPAPKTEC